MSIGLPTAVPYKTANLSDGERKKSGPQMQIFLNNQLKLCMGTLGNYEYLNLLFTPSALLQEQYCKQAKPDKHKSDIDNMYGHLHLSLTSHMTS